MENIQNKNKELAIYLLEHKELRLGQNLTNFFGVPFLLIADEYDWEEEEYVNIRDCFFDENLPSFELVDKDEEQ